MKLKLITNEGVSNEFLVRKEPSGEEIGIFQFNPGDEIEFTIDEGEELRGIALDSNFYQFESGSI